MLLERERELGVIGDGLDEAVAGRGSLLVIEGPAGIGKSALLSRAREAAHARNVAVAHARGSELERADAFGVVRQLFEPRLRGMTESARARALDGAAALAAPVVLPETAPAGDGSEFATLHGLYWLLAGLAAERPQLLAVDDLHWADEASGRFLAFLANRLEEAPVLLLVAQRPHPEGALRVAAGAVVIEPAALSAEASALVLGDGAEPAFAAAFHEATGGNPLLVRRLAAGLRERADPEAIARRGPDVVAGAVSAAMARLGGEPVALARAVAILGDDAPLAVAAALAGLPNRTASEAAGRLARAGILEDGRPLRFQHALVRDAVLGSLTAGERADAHGEAARMLARHGAPGRIVAAHLLHTEPGGDAALAETLAAEGRRALAAGAPLEARDLFARALEEPPPPGARHALLLGLARAEQHLGDPHAIAHVRAAYDAAGDPLERAHAALSVMWASGPTPDEVAGALEMIEPAAAGLGEGERELGLQLEAARLMMLFLRQDRIAEWMTESERHATLAGATVGECLLLLNAALARFIGGRPADEIAFPVERIPAGPLAAIGADAPWLSFAIGMLFKTDRLEAAGDVADVAIAEARRTTSASGFAIASVWRGWVDLRRGDAESAEAHARAAMDSAPESGWQRPFCAAGLAEVLAERAQLDEAVRVADGDGGIAGVNSDVVLSARAIVRMARGDAEGALADQRAARASQGRGLAMDANFDGWVRTARLLHLTGDADGARAEAGAALAWARGFGTPDYIGQALTVSGLIEGGKSGLSRLHEAVETLERSPSRRDLARSLVDLGAALRRDGRRVAAREPLRRALDIAAAGGLTATAELAREELRATGARVRTDHATGVASLTPSERRIAERAAAGASNPEIAQALFVTTKTVEMHLSRVYRKLDIASRGQLAGAMQSPG